MRGYQIKKSDRYSYDSSTEGSGKRKRTRSSEFIKRSLSRRTPPPPLSDTEWNALVAKGQQLYQDVAIALQNPEDKECPNISDHNSAWDIQGRPGPPNETLQRIIRFVNPTISFDPRSTWQYLSAEWPAGSLDPLYYYRNFFSPQTRTIVAYENWGKGEMGRAPVRLSDMSFQLWRSTSVQRRLPTQSLTWIWQEHILNADTLKVMKYIYDRDGWWAKDAEGADTTQTQAWVFGPSQSAFYALLATPNAIGYSYMLKDYPESLGSTIKRVGIAWIDLVSLDEVSGSDSDGNSDPEDLERELYYMWIELQPPAGY